MVPADPVSLTNESMNCAFGDMFSRLLNLPDSDVAQDCMVQEYEELWPLQLYIMVGSLSFGALCASVVQILVMPPNIVWYLHHAIIKPGVCSREASV